MAWQGRARVATCLSHEYMPNLPTTLGIRHQSLTESLSSSSGPGDRARKSTYFHKKVKFNQGHAAADNCLRADVISVKQ